MADDPLTSDLRFFGLEDLEAEAFVRLSRLGRSRASSLSSALKMNRTTTYRVLERLKKLGIVESSLTRPVSFVAIEPTRALQILLEKRKEEVKDAEAKLPTVLQQFTQFYIPAEDAVDAKFMILQGTEEIHRTITKMSKSATKSIAMITTTKDLGKMYYTGAYEALLDSKSRNVDVVIVTEINEQFLEVVNRYDFAQIRHKAEARMKMIVKDQQEVIITVSSKADEEVALWTRSQSFASAMQSIINNEFYTGIGLEAIKTSLRTGKPAESLKIVAGGDEYMDTTLMLLASAQKEVFIGFNFYPTFVAPAILQLIKTIAQNGVKVKVLSVPSADEFGIVNNLQGLVEFRISAFQTDVQILMVDGKEMLFSNSPKSEIPGAGLNIHTNLTGMVSFIYKITNDMWLDSKRYALEHDVVQQSISLANCVDMIRTKMREQGMEIELGTKILGNSGVLHEFDIISPSTREGNNRVAISILAHSDLDSTGTKLMESRIKMLDCQPLDLLVGLLVRPKDAQEVISKIGKAAGVRIIQAANPESLASAIFAEIEKRY